MMIKDYMLSENTLLEDFVITKRSDGRFFTRIRISYNSVLKKYIYKNIYGKDKFEVKLKRAEYIKEKIKEQEYKNITVNSLDYDIQNWLYNNKYGSVKNICFDRLEEVYFHQILPVIKEYSEEYIKTEEVKEKQCRLILDHCLKKGYSYSSILKCYRFLNEFFNYLHQNGKYILIRCIQ